jgi:hypothetical protein
MSDWPVLFLGVIAVATTVQCIALVVAAISLKSSGERLSQLCRQFETELKPALDDLRKGAANLRAISDSGRAQAERIEALIATTLESVETAVESARVLIMKPLGTLSELAAFWGGIRQGIDTYRSEAPRSAPPPGPARRSEDSDEHMFIG